MARAYQAEEILDEIEDILICSWISPPKEFTPEAWRKAIYELLTDGQEIAIYFEHQRLIKLNEDFYGPTHRDETIPFLR